MGWFVAGLFCFSAHNSSTKRLRRFNQWNGPLDSLLIPISTAKGFTDHEHLDAVGLIHMNGRVYDPELGRFMSADPFVQAPYNSQSYNRYSYVFNNPLSFTDPSGYECYEVNVGSQTAGGAEGSDKEQYDSQRKTVSTNGSLCGQDGYNFGQSWQNQINQSIDSLVLEAVNFSGVPTALNAWVDVNVAINTGDHSAIKPILVMAAVELGTKKISKVPGLAKVAKAVEKKVEKALGTNAPPIKPGASGGETAGKRFPESVKDAAKAENPNKVCVYCRMEGTGTQVDHAKSRATNGNATLENAQLACPHCNASKGAGEFPKSRQQIM